VNPNKTSQGKCRGPNRKIGGETKRKRIFFCLWDLRDEFLTGTMMTIRTCFSDLSFYLFFFFLSVSFDLFLLWKCPPTAAAAAGLCPFSIDCYSPKRVRCVAYNLLRGLFLQFLFTFSFFASKFTIRFYRLWKFISWAKDLSARGYSLNFLFLSFFLFRWPANLSVYYFIRDSSSCNFLPNLTVRRWRRFFLFLF
jgi:hypothetical protein